MVWDAGVEISLLSLLSSDCDGSVGRGTRGGRVQSIGFGVKVKI